MKNKLKLSALCALSATLCAALPAVRQGQSLFGNQKPRHAFNELQTVNASRPPLTALPESADPAITGQRDTACYLALSKRHGWYYGIGPQLSKAEAGKVPCYFRLTEKDSLGHFTKIEALNGSGLYTRSHGLATYLSEATADETAHPYDDTDNMAGAVVQWRLYPSADAKRLSMESGFDAAGNLIYTYISTLLNDTTAVGHYVDSFGEPVSLLAGENAARYVQVNYDSLGFEHRIRYLDNDAHFKRNTDGAFMLRKKYDTDGNTVMAISCTMNGIPITDDWGNCGWQATYNSRGQMVTKTYLDENLRPMKMPRLRNNRLDIMSRHFSYDNLHRLVRESYFGDNGDRDTTRDGVHGKEWKYDSRGNVINETTKDKYDRLCGREDGIAEIVYTYTPHGKLQSTLYKNKDGAPQPDRDGVCLYAGKNKYCINAAGDTIPVYVETVDDRCVTTYDYKANLVHVYRTDENGQEIESAYYTTDRRPVQHDGYIRRTTAFRKSGDREIQETETYSLTDTIRTVTITDVRACTRIQQQFNNNDRLLSSFGQTLSDDLETVTGQYGFDALGNIARSHLEDAMYYKVKSGTTYRGATSFMAGKNEYDEPSYVAESEASASYLYCTKLFGSDGKVTLLDEDNNRIVNPAELRRRLGRVYCIEVMTPRAVELGLKSGDVIVKLGNFSYTEPDSDNWRPRDRLQIETYLTRNTAKDIMLLRFFAGEKRHRLISLTLPPGTPEDLGFIIQTVFYTGAEAARYTGIVNEYLASHNISADSLVNDRSSQWEKPVCLIRPFKISTAQMTAWQQGLRQDAITLGVSNHMTDGSETYADMSDGFDKLWEQSVAGCDSKTVYYTINGTDIRHVVMPGEGSAVSRSFFSVPDDEYAGLLGLSAEILKPPFIKALGTKYSPQQAYRCIADNIKSLLCEHVRRTDPKFDKQVKVASRFTDDKDGIDLSWVTDIYYVKFDDDNPGKDRRMAVNVLDGIDWSDFSTVRTDKCKAYLRDNRTGGEGAAQFVLYHPEGGFLIFAGGNDNPN